MNREQQMNMCRQVLSDIEKHFLNGKGVENRMFYSHPDEEHVCFRMPCFG